MKRLTTDKPTKEMEMYELAHNCMINKDGESWYRDFDREIRLRDLVRAALKEYENLEYYKRCDSDDYLDEQLVEWSQIPPEEDFYGLLSRFYVLAWSNADLREALKHYEDMEEQGKLLILPCKPGDTVYLICSRYTKCTKYGEEFEESSCCGCEEDCDSHKEFYIHINRSVSLEWIVRMMNYFGKTVFLTEQKAHEALAEMEETNHEKA